MLTESRSVDSVESRGLAFLEASVQLPEAFPPARVIQASSTQTMGYSKTLWISSRASFYVGANEKDCIVLYIILFIFQNRITQNHINCFVSCGIMTVLKFLWFIKTPLYCGC